MRISRYWWMLIGATASGLLAGYVALVYVSEEPAPLEAATAPARSIVVASRDLPAGAIVRREDVETVAWPGSAVPEGFSTQAGEVVGRGLIVEVRKNEPLLGSKLAEKEAGGGLPDHDPRGHARRLGRGRPGHRRGGVRASRHARRRAGHGHAGQQPDADHDPDHPPEHPGPRGRPEVPAGHRRRAAVRDGRHASGDPPARRRRSRSPPRRDASSSRCRNTLDLDEVETRGPPHHVAGRRSGSTSRSRAAPSRPARPANPERVIESFEGGSRTLLKFGTRRRTMSGSEGRNGRMARSLVRCSAAALLVGAMLLAATACLGPAVHHRARGLREPGQGHVRGAGEPGGVQPGLHRRSGRGGGGGGVAERGAHQRQEPGHDDVRGLGRRRRAPHLRRRGHGRRGGAPASAVDALSRRGHRRLGAAATR